MTESQVRERAVLDLLRARYERRGDVFFAYPPRELVPSFLDDYRPDAIAKKATGDGGSVIEVKGSDSTRAGRLPEIAERFRAHPEWDFVVVVPDDVPELRQEFAAESPTTISNAIAEMNELDAAGHARAAFVMGWSIIEAFARVRLAGTLKNPNRSFSPTALAETLEQYGLISATEGRDLRALVSIRNSAVHGDFQYDVTPQAMEIVRKIVATLGRAPMEA